MHVREKYIPVSLRKDSLDKLHIFEGVYVYKWSIVNHFGGFCPVGISEVGNSIFNPVVSFRVFPISVVPVASRPWAICSTLGGQKGNTKTECKKFEKHKIFIASHCEGFGHIIFIMK